MINAIFTNEKFTWWDIVNPTPLELHKISVDFGLHYQTIKDVMEPHHLPKFEVFDSTFFCIVRMVDNEANSNSETTQELTSKIVLFINERFLITIHRNEFSKTKELVNKVLVTDSNPFSAALRVFRYGLRTYLDPLFKIENEIETLEDKMINKQQLRTVMVQLFKLKRKIYSYKKMTLLHIETLEEWADNEQDAMFDKALLNDVFDLCKQLETQQEKVNEGLRIL
jgi:magnesium transporter